jgi:syringate O-demethylase
VPCSPDGFVIGDVILFGLADDRVNLVGRAPALNWVTFRAQTGEYKVDLTFDQRTALRPDLTRRHYRFQVQGPNAMAVLEKALGHEPADLKFFNMRTETIAGKQVMALRHGMAGQPGWELFGPYEDHDAVHEALVKAGEEFDMKLVGGRAYGSNAIESGWIPSPLPAVYTGDALSEYREWLPPTGYEASAVARRQLRLERHRGLLLHALGHRLWPPGQVRPRLRRARGARGQGAGEAPHQGHARPRRRGRHADPRLDAQPGR